MKVYDGVFIKYGDIRYVIDIFHSLPSIFHLMKQPVYGLDAIACIRKSR